MYYSKLRTKGAKSKRDARLCDELNVTRRDARSRDRTAPRDVYTIR